MSTKNGTLIFHIVTTSMLAMSAMLVYHFRAGNISSSVSTILGMIAILTGAQFFRQTTAGDRWILTVVGIFTVSTGANAGLLAWHLYQVGVSTPLAVFYVLVAVFVAAASFAGGVIFWNLWLIKPEEE